MLDSPVRVRPADAADANGIADVHVTSWRETYSGIVPDRLMGVDALEARRRMWASILHVNPLPGAVAVAERDGQLVGFAFAGSASHPDASKGPAPARDEHLYCLYLLAREQGSGTGRALLEATLEDRPAQLWVLDANVRARAFYERQGFRTDGAEFVDPDLNRSHRASYGALSSGTSPSGRVVMWLGGVVVAICDV